MPQSRLIKRLILGLIYEFLDLLLTKSVPVGPLLLLATLF
jgi:hypothetical protein